MHEGINDAVIIRDETKELKDVTILHDEKKRDLIIRAAGKLAEKYEDKSVICSRLQKEWRDINISQTYIKQTLPDEYKRDYTKKEIKTEDVTEAQEYLKELEDIHLAQAKLLHEYRRVAESRPELDDQISQILADVKQMKRDIGDAVDEVKLQMDDSVHYLQISEWLKSIQTECHAINTLVDCRQHFTTAWKFSLKLIFNFKSHNHVATLLANSKKNSAKWLSDIHKDEETAHLFRTVGKCPRCDWDWTLWWEKAKYALANGRKMPLIQTIERKSKNK